MKLFKSITSSSLKVFKKARTVHFRKRLIGELESFEQLRDTTYFNDYYSSISNHLIPKQLWIYWDKGSNSMPYMQSRCVETAFNHNKDWQINLLSSKDVFHMYPDLSKLISKITVQAFADVLRIRLLRDFGGVWCDATLFHSTGLDTFLPSLVESTGFIAPLNVKQGRSYKKFCCRPSNWFLAASKNNPIVRLWSKASEIVISKGQPIDYFWPHTTFEALCNINSSFEDTWIKSIHLNQARLEYLQALIIRDDLSLARDYIKLAPIHKLSSKQGLENCKKLLMEIN